ncbi:MAG: hypothetical protein HQL95_07475, partial [Magnetococcales bacterium]|nr:hypothetical protein [Magnetococcales bacterium]
MKGLLSIVAHKHGKWLLMVGLAPMVTACAHTIDPTQAPLTTYEMPAAVVVQTTPAMLIPGSPWQVPATGNATPTTYAPYSAGGAGASQPPTVAATTDANGFPAGATVIRQAPITIERPSIVVNQPPVWVGNPPVAIPQPPVVMHQAPITIEQPAFVVQPPRVGFQVPVPVTPAVDAKPTPEPKAATPAVEEKKEEKTKAAAPKKPARE